jgi:hypothetical protein
MAQINNNNTIVYDDVFDGLFVVVPYYDIELWGDDFDKDKYYLTTECIKSFTYDVYPVNDTHFERQLIEKLNIIVNDIRNKDDRTNSYYEWITDEEEEGNYTNLQVRVILYDCNNEVKKCIWERYVSDILETPEPVKKTPIKPTQKPKSKPITTKTKAKLENELNKIHEEWHQGLLTNSQKEEIIYILKGV